MRQGLIALLALGLCHCAAAPLVRVSDPSPGDADSPSLAGMLDLGGRPLPEWGELNVAQSDGRYAPGEWIALRGTALHAQPQLRIDGHEVEVRGYLEDGGLLFRMPAEISPAGRHVLTVKTTGGEDALEFEAIRWVAGSDTDGQRLHFLRLSNEGDRMVEKTRPTIAQTRTLLQARSPDGALLYAVGVANRKKGAEGQRYQLELKVIDLAAKDAPAEVGAVKLELSSTPVAMAVAPNGRLAILGHRHLALLRTDNPLAPEPAGTLALQSPHPKATYTDLLFLDRGRRLALLEVWGNRVELIDVEKPEAPALLTQRAIATDTPLPVSVALCADPFEPEVFWVVQGPNLRVAGERVKEGVAAMQEMAAGLFADDEAKEDAKSEGAEEEEKPSLSRLLRLDASGDSLTPKGARRLPADFFPFFAAPNPEGGLLVSGVNGDVLNFAGVDASLDGAKRVWEVLKDSPRFGRLLRVPPEKGDAELVFAGVSLFFDIDPVPGVGVVYSGMRLTGKMLPPFLAVAWGIGVGDGNFHSLRKLDWKVVLPPYAAGQVSAMR